MILLDARCLIVHFQCLCTWGVKFPCPTETKSTFLTFKLNCQTLHIYIAVHVQTSQVTIRKTHFWVEGDSKLSSMPSVSLMSWHSLLGLVSASESLAVFDQFSESSPEQWRQDLLWRDGQQLKTQAMNKHRPCDPVTLKPHHSSGL